MRALASLLLIAGCSNPSILAPDPPPAERIGLRRSSDADLTPAQPKRYRIELAADQVARGVVMQQGVDAIITTFDPTGKKLGEFDSPNGDNGPEPFFVVGGAAGAYDIEVRAFAPPDGSGAAVRGKVHTSIDELITRDAYEAAELAKHVDSPRIRELYRAARHHDAAAIDAFWKQLAGHAPILEPYPGDPNSALVTWVMRSSQPYVGMVGGVPRDEAAMTRIEGTDVFYMSARVPSDARLLYSFLENTQAPRFHEPWSAVPALGRYANAEPDPSNPRADHGMSVFELPGAPQATYAEVRAGVAKGTLTEIHVTSAAMKQDRRVGVYLPPGYDPKQTYPLVIAFDGEVYGLPPEPPALPLPTILDNLIADRKIPPVVAALVANQDGARFRDLTYSTPFSDFLAGELVPRIRADYHAGLSPAQTLVTGSSLGGLASTFLALHHSDVVGNVLSNSGSYQIHPERFVRDLADYTDPGVITGDFIASPRLAIRFYLDCGTFEGGLRDANRRFRDVLRAKGYDVTYREFSGDHDYGEWRRTFADGLVALLGQRS